MTPHPTPHLTPHPSHVQVMIVPQYSAELKLPSALDFFDLKKWISRFSLEKVEKGSKDFKVDWVEMFAQGQAFTQWLEQRKFFAAGQSIMSHRRVKKVAACVIIKSIH